MAAIPSFLFGAGTKYKTQEELDRAREQVKALLGDIGESKFTGWGSVLADLGKGISAGIEGRRINEGQEWLTDAQAPFAQTLAEIGGYSGASPDDIVATSGEDTLTGKGSGDVDLSGDKAAFVAALMPAAVEHGARIGVDPRIIVAQAAQETGWGKHAPNNNYFGIKSHGKGGGQTFATNEVINGKRVRINDSFRKFDSPADSVAGYADFLASNKRYGPMRSAQGLDAQLRELGASGYATDPNYAASVGAIARSLPLVGGAGASGQAGGAGMDPINQAFTSPPPSSAPVPVRNVPVGDAGLRTPAGADFLSRMGSPAPMSGGPQALPMVPGMNGPMPPPSPRQPTLPVPAPVPPPQQVPQPFDLANRRRITPDMVPDMFQLNPSTAPGRLSDEYVQPNAAPAPAPAPAPVPVPQPQPVPTPRPAPKVDPFTDMILGDKASQFKPGNYIPPAPVGAQVFPAAPPAPGTPAAAGFGVPPVVGGGGADQLAGKGTFPPAPAPPQAAGAQGGITKIGKLMTILASPHASDEMKRMATVMLNREYALEDERRKANTPEAQIDFKIKQAQLAGLLNKDDVDDVVVVGKRLYNKKTKEWIDPPAGEDDVGPFDSTSVEGQALNGMVKNGTLTVQQAYAVAAGKVVTDPETGRMIFKTPQGLVGAAPGQPPQPIVSAQGGQPAATQSNAPAGTSAAATQPGTVAESGGTVLTGAKPAAPPSETERRNAALYTVASPELKIVERMFPALGNIDDQLLSKMPWNSSNWATSEDYQRGKNALQSLITSYMFVVSGSDTPPAQVALIAEGLMPQPGEKPASVKDKLARVRSYVEAMKQAAGRAVDDGAPAAGGGGNVDYKTIYGLE